MFPFSPLPLVPQELILKELSPVDIFFFSLISKKSHLLAKRFKLVVKSVRWIVYKGFTVIDLEAQDEDFSALRISSRKPDLENWLPKFDAQIDGIKFSVIEPFPPSLKVIPSENVAVLAKGISNRLMDVLRPQKFYLNINECPIPPYIFQLTRTFELVSVYFDDETVHNDDAMAIFNEITTEFLTLHYPAFTVLEDQPLLKHRTIQLIEATWFTKDLLMNTQCEDLRVYDSYLTSVDLQEFFEKWKEGNFPKLQKLHIQMKNGFQWNLNLAPVDEEGKQVIKDVGGNVGKLCIDEHDLKFFVNS